MGGSVLPPGPPPDSSLAHERLLARQMAVHGILRYGVAALILCGTLFAGHVVGVEGLPMGHLVLMSLIIATLNTGVVLAVRAGKEVSDSGPRRRGLLALQHGTIVADYLALAVLIELVGGARSPFMIVFVLHIVLGCFMVSESAAWAYTVFALLLVQVLTFGELAGYLEPHLPAGAVLGPDPFDPRYAVSLATVYSFLFVVTTALLTRLAESMRQDERRLITAKAALQELSSARRDFLHVALHNMKAPVAAATMLLHNVREGLAGSISEKQRELVERSLARLAEADRFVRDLGLLANLELHELANLDGSVPIAELLPQVRVDLSELAENRGQRLTGSLPSPDLVAQGNARLLREAVVNLLTNAIKFTPRGGTIELGAQLVGEAIEIWVRDQGPGIEPSKQGQLFREFSRLGTRLPDGERPQGSGLGLSIVRRIVEAHGGRVGVRSALGAGSTFWIQIPRARAADGTPPDR